MATTQPQPKGILKKPSAPPAAAPHSPPSSSSPPSTLTRAELLAKQETAARLRLLQKLRDTELKPAIPPETFELLCQLPTPPVQPATTPSAADATLLLTTLRDFQPSEYLDLIEERNCLGKCGYALCGRPHRTHPGPYKLSATGGGAVARTADLNKWCSDACARRALHLKVQLDNPSYERDPAGTGRMVVRLELRDESESGTTTAGKKKAVGAGSGPGPGAGAAAVRGSEEDRNKLAQAMAQLEIDKQKQVKRDAARLAGEWGDPGGVFTGVSRVEVTIKESAADGPVQAPTASDEDAFMKVDGYKPTFGTAKSTDKSAENDEDDDADDDDFFTLRF